MTSERLRMNILQFADISTNTDFLSHKFLFYVTIVTLYLLILIFYIFWDVLMPSERLRINFLQFNLTLPQVLTFYLIILTFLTLYDQCHKYDTSHHIKTLLYIY